MKKMSHENTLKCIILLLLVVFTVCYISASSKKEGYENVKFPFSLGEYPSVDTNYRLLPNDMYPPKNPVTVTDKSVFQRGISKYYPAVELGSYEQKTNNVRYPSLPEYGDCTPTEFCESFYLKKEKK